ncbi:hypothetical protein WH47_10541 [Habropoda laboriosa]|uniref:Uncharacterized protein n=1 Tax=Habropoda laboriosa TaxID=597456 RepID=A0A0L7QMR8_9HYME|nr:hypothetical protein WH47_10541 [Habropoda laboriosa]
MLSLVVLCILTTQASALVGYDYGSRTLNVSTFSTIDSLDCNPEEIQPTAETRNIQLLQLSDFNSAQVTQCKLEIDRTIYYCGMHSHTSIVANGRRQYLFPSTRETCTSLHTTGAIFINPATQITGVRANSTTHYSLTLAGTIGPDGTCSGTSYSDPHGTWNNAIVQAVVKISIRNYKATVKLSSNQIILQSGQRCELQTGNCLDSENGYTYWNTLPTDYCNFRKYDVLYDGKVNRVSSRKREGPTIYTVTSGETVFALTQTTTTTLCGFTLIKTEHPKLFIIDVNRNGRFKPASTISVNLACYVMLCTCS